MTVALREDRPIYTAACKHTVSGKMLENFTWLWRDIEGVLSNLEDLTMNITLNYIKNKIFMSHI